MFKDIEDLKVEITKFQDNLISTNGLVEKVSSIILIGSQNNILAEKLLLHINEMILKNDDEFAKMLLITNVVPLLLGTFAGTCSLNLPQKGRKAGHDCLWAVA